MNQSNGVGLVMSQTKHMSQVILPNLSVAHAQSYKLASISPRNSGSVVFLFLWDGMAQSSLTTRFGNNMWHASVPDMGFKCMLNTVC